jgi:hypothetical protein
MKELSEIERQIGEQVESLASIEKSEIEVTPFYLHQTSLPLSSYLSVGLFCFILNVFVLTASLAFRLFCLQAAETQRQSRKRFLAALEDCSRAEAVSKKLKMERIVAQATIWVQKEDVAQERVRMAAMHAFFMPGCSMSVGDDG